MRYRLVLFDLGGVVMGSPLAAIAEFERATGLEPGFVGRVIGAGGETGAWSRLERGELRPEIFHAEFALECEQAGSAVDTSALFERIAEVSQPRPRMLRAIERIRESGRIAAALTNNWAHDDAPSGTSDLLGPHFDAIFESAKLGLRKPDPRIYTHACAEVGVGPHDTVFLDDIGANLKTARAMGMLTIKVDDPDRALDELSRQLDLPLG